MRFFHTFRRAFVNAGQAFQSVANRLRRMGSAGVAMWFAIALASFKGVLRGIEGKQDWLYWEEECRFVWENAEVASNTGMFGYLPGAFVLLIPLAAWPPRSVGLLLLATTQLAAIWITATLVRKHWMSGDRPDHSRNETCWYGSAGPVLLLNAGNLYSVLYWNQLSLGVLALMVGGVALVGRGRPFFGGILMGAATAIKAPAAMLIAYCAWKRRAIAVVGGITGILLFDVVPSLLFFGAARAWEEHVQWWRRASAHGHSFNIAYPAEHRENQSLSSALSRWLRKIPDTPEHWVIRGLAPQEVEDAIRKGEIDGTLSVTRSPLRPEFIDHADFLVNRLRPERRQGWNIADIDETRVEIVWVALCVVLVVGLFSMTRTREPPRGSEPTDDNWWGGAALWMLAIFWLSPYSYENHFVWALPAVAIVWSACFETPSALSRRSRIACAIALALWAAAQLGRKFPALEFYGIQLWATFPLAGAAWMADRSRGRKSDTGECDEQRGEPSMRVAGIGGIAIIALLVCLAIAGGGCGRVDVREDYDRWRVEILSRVGFAAKTPLSEKSPDGELPDGFSGDVVRAPSGSTSTSDDNSAVVQWNEDFAVRSALERHPSVRAALARIGIAKADFAQAGLLPNPDLGGSIRFALGSPANLAAAIGQPLLLLQIPARQRAAARMLNVAVLRSAETVLADLSAVRRTYQELSNSEALLLLQKEMISNYSRTVRATRDRQEGGAATGVDVNLAETQLQSAVMDLIALEGRRERLRAEFAARVGWSRWKPEWSLAVAPKPDGLSGLLPALAKALSEAFANRLDLKVATAQVLQAEAELAQAKLSLVPVLSAGLDFERQPPDYFGPAFSIPLPIFDQGIPRVSRAEYALAEARRNRESVELTAYQEVAGAHAELTAAVRQVEQAEERLVPIAEKNLALAEATYRGGQGNLLHVLAAQQAYLGARQRMLNAVRDYRIQAAELDRAVGRWLSWGVD